MSPEQTGDYITMGLGLQPLMLLFSLTEVGGGDLAIPTKQDSQGSAVQLRLFGAPENVQIVAVKIIAKGYCWIGSKLSRLVSISLT